jgi:hypothetical protein
MYGLVPAKQIPLSCVLRPSFYFSSFLLFLFCFVLFLFVCLFPDRVSLCNPGRPGTHSVDQAGLELRNPPVSASQVLGLKAWATTARQLVLERELKWTVHHKINTNSIL